MAAWLLLLLLVGGVFAVGAAARDDVVRFYPPAVQVYDLVGLDVDREIAMRSAGIEPGLSFQDVDARLSSTVDGEAVVISGVLVNQSGQQRSIRPIAASLLDASGAVLERWEIGTGRATLAAGERVEFSTRRNAWPSGAVDVRLGLVPLPTGR